jgi:hypothetical protein
VRLIDWIGGFCGYRNIQMMASYIIASRHPGHTHFKKKIPSIFRIQDWVEKAWDEGINSHCRAETGGIRMTRKFIGTAEAAACFQYLGISYVHSSTLSTASGE